MLKLSPHQSILSQAGSQQSKVSICLSVSRQSEHILGTLHSIHSQTQNILDLIIIDNQSSDHSLRTTQAWLNQNSHRFNRIKFAKHQSNFGLYTAWNTCVLIANTPYVFILDANSILFPRCIARCLEVLEAESNASIAYPITAACNDKQALFGNIVCHKSPIADEQGIDTIFLVRRDDFLKVGGYSELSEVIEQDSKDPTLWNKLFSQGFYGVPVGEILASLQSEEYSQNRSKDRHLEVYDHSKDEDCQESCTLIQKNYSKRKGAFSLQGNSSFL